MSGPGDGIEGIHDPPTGSFDTAAIAAAGAAEAAGARHGASRFAGHNASDRFSTKAPGAAGRVTPMASWAIANGGYLRAMLGNLYFAIPLAGFVLGVIAGISTSGLAVPPVLGLTLVLIALGAFDAFAGLMALAGFTVVSLVTGNLIGPHMFSAAPGQQTVWYALGGLLGLAALWFVGAEVALRLRPMRLHRTGSGALVWSRRILDVAFVGIVGTFVIWFAAWQLPVLAGNRPQELFVSIQDHLLPVKIVALVALVARMSLEMVAGYHFAERTAAVTPPKADGRNVIIAAAFWVFSGAFAFIVLWEFLGFGWMTWVLLALFYLVGVAAWAGRGIRRKSASKHWQSLHALWFALVVFLIGLLLSGITKHLVNPTPMLGAISIGIGVLVVIAAFLGQFAGVGRRQSTASTLLDALAIVLLVLLVYGVIGFLATPFSGPRGVYAAPTGAVFVTDTNNNRLVLIYKTGFRESVPIDGGLLRPSDVTADGDPKGYVYIADAGHDRIVRLSGYYHYTVGSHTFNLALAAGEVTQKNLGSGLKDPQSVSVDGLGNLYIADTGNNRIVMINRVTGRQSTFLTGLSGPLAVLADPFYTRTVYVANTGAGTVLRITPDGVHHVMLRGLDEPSGLAEDPYGNFFISQLGNGTVLEVPRYGSPSVVLRGLQDPRGLCVDGYGNLFVSNSNAGQIKVIASLREQQLQTHGMPDPSAVAYVDEHTVYVVDRSQGWLQEWHDGVLRTAATGLTQPVGVAATASPSRVWVDQADGTLLLVDTVTGTARKVLAGLSDPRQLWSAPDGSGAVLVAEKGSGQILEVSTSGRVSIVVSGLHEPVGVAEDAQGDVTVGLQNGNVYLYPPSGKSEKLYNLRGITAIAMDGAGNSYVASSKYRLVVMHVVASGRDIVVNRNFLSLDGMSASPTGTLWIADRRSVGLIMVRPSYFILQL